MKRYEMLIQPSRGGLKEGVSFGYVDVPQRMAGADRAVLVGVAEGSLVLGKGNQNG